MIKIIQPQFSYSSSSTFVNQRSSEGYKSCVCDTNKTHIGRFNGRRGKLRLRLLACLAVTSCVLIGWMIIATTAGSTKTVPQPDLTRVNGNVAAATAQLQAEVQKNPRSAHSWGKYGKFLMAHEWNSEALESFYQAGKLDSNNMQWPYLAAILEDRRDPVKAVELFRKAESIDESYAPLYVRLGNTLLRLARTDEAKIAFTEAIRRDASHPQPLVGLARVASSQRQWTTAVQQLEQAVKIAPNNREALVELARAKLMAGTNQPLNRSEQIALTSNEKFVAMPDPIFQSVNEQEVAARFVAMQADLSASQGDMGAAAATYTKLISQRPDLVRPRLNLASVYMSQGQLPLALITLRETVALFPNDAMAHYALSFALEASHQFGEARAEREKAIVLKPDYGDAHYALGLSLERDGDLESAVKSYRRAIQSDARLAQAHLALGLGLQKQGRLDEAIAEITAAVKLSPGDKVPLSFLEKAKQAASK